jgi:hypothetical protein
MAKATGKDLALSCVELAPGLVIDTKIKMGAIWYLEDKYDKPINEIVDQIAGKDKSGNRSIRIRDAAYIIIGLALQHDGNMTESQATYLFKQLSPEQLQAALSLLDGIFQVDIDTKNSQGAGPIVENKMESTGPAVASSSAENMVGPRPKSET